MTERLLGSATQEKAEVPPSACVRRIAPPYRGLTQYSLSTPIPPSVEAPIEKKGGKRYPPKGRRDLVTASAASDLIPVPRRFRAPRHERNYRFQYQGNKKGAVSLSLLRELKVPLGITVPSDNHHLQLGGRTVDALSVFQEKTQECLTSWVPRSHVIGLA